jgi:hypothetical protein
MDLEKKKGRGTGYMPCSENSKLSLFLEDREHGVSSPQHEWGYNGPECHTEQLGTTFSRLESKRYQDILSNT